MTRWIAPLLILLASCDAARGGPPAVGKPAPEFEAVALEGARPVSLKALRGRPVLLNVWATWCHPCRQEIPALQKIHQTRKGLEVVGVSIDEPGQDAEIRSFLRQYGATYPVWLDPDDRVASTFATVGVPTTFLIGADGTLLWKHVGPVSAEDPVLGRALDTALSSHRDTEAQR
ncbi:MAG TPA: TlpA disulfide reductase family protein [Longimicrobium sp.]|jgi:cytochrome c biogenesis protein CcmG/thiol:disulfide interchange protein DsbE